MSKQTMQQTAADHNIWIEPVANHPGRWTAHIGSVALPMSSENVDGILRARDLDLAAWLGFKTLYDIRKTIRRMVADGKFNEFELFATAAKTSGGRPGREFWLTREQALLVTTQSETPKAWEVTKVMVRVFDRVQDIIRGPMVDGPTMAKMIRDALIEERPRLRAEIIEELRAERAANQIGDGVSIGKRVAKAEILLPLRALAKRRAKADALLSRATHCGKLHTGLRDELGMGMHTAWADLPVGKLPVARALIGTWMREVEDREARIRGMNDAIDAARQQPLPFAGKN